MKTLPVLSALLLATTLAPSPTHAQTEVVITFPETLRAEPATGRLLLLMAPPARRSDPLEAPFWDNPHPIYSIAVENVRPGEPMRIDDFAAGFPVPLSQLDGTYTVQAVLDLDSTTSGFRNWPENLISQRQRLRFDPNEPQVYEFPLVRRMPVRTYSDTQRVREAVLRSERLSDFFGRDVFLRAGVVLPPDYDESQRWYPAIYQIPGFSGRHYDAWRSPAGRSELDRHAVRIVLDPDGPFGHHLFVNSENNGPVGEALIHEFIPHLETRFRLIPKPEARLITGHSSGGFTTVWLQINYPEVFGGSWATAPDPVDFRAFQSFDIYSDANAYVDAEGEERPSVINDGRVACTIRQENGMEQALDPNGASGQQWDSWIACFSPRGPDGYPVGLWDRRSGEIDPEIAQFWKKRDPRHIIESRWDEVGPLLSQRLRILCGDADNFDLHLAVMRLRDVLDALPGWRSEGETTDERAAHGYIEIIPGADHYDITNRVGLRIREEMLLHLRRHGLAE